MTKVLEAFLIFGVTVLPLAKVWRTHNALRRFQIVAYLFEKVFLLASVFLVVRLNSIPLRNVGFFWPLPRELFFHLSVTMGVIFGLEAVALAAARKNFARTSVADVSASRPQGILAILAVCSVGAVWEELCFRGVPRYLAGHKPGWILIALIGSSIVFAWQHISLGLQGVGFAAFYGIVFFLLFLATGDLTAVMVAHAAGNVFTLTYGAKRHRQLTKPTRQWDLSFIG